MYLLRQQILNSRARARGRPRQRDFITRGFMLYERVEYTCLCCSTHREATTRWPSVVFPNYFFVPKLPCWGTSPNPQPQAPSVTPKHEHMHAAMTKRPIVQCQYMQSPMDVDCENSVGHYSCMNGRKLPIDESLHHGCWYSRLLRLHARYKIECNTCI